MRIYKLPHYTNVSDRSLWKALKKFLHCVRHHVSLMHEQA